MDSLDHRQHRQKGHSFSTNCPGLPKFCTGLYIYIYIYEITDSISVQENLTMLVEHK